MIASRRTVLAGGLTVAFSLVSKSRAQDQSGAPRIASELPGDLSKFPDLDAWIRLDADGRFTVFTGKAELGQGLKTAMLQLAADELDIDMANITLVTADTARSPDEGVTAGSHSMQDSGTAVVNAAANVRRLLIEAATARWGVASERALTDKGVVRSWDGRTLRYGELAAGMNLHVAATPGAARLPANCRHWIGQSVKRVDIPAKLTGGAAYVQDMRLPDMLHARVVRGPVYGAELFDPGFEAAQRFPGVLRVVRDGRFAAVLAEREWDAIRALRGLQKGVWRQTRNQPQADFNRVLRAMPSRPIQVFEYPGPGAPAVKTLKAAFTRPFLMHGSIGPSCAVAQWSDDALTVWTHSQGVGPLRRALAELLRLPLEKVRCIHVEGSGCYGHNGADDVAADAALAARSVPGRPVRLQWMREQEHGWEPLGPAMSVDLEAGLDAAGRVCRWRCEIWSNEHNTRPVTAGGLLAGLEVEPPFPPQKPKPIPMPEGGAARNSNPIYAFPDALGIYHFPEEAPFRVSALRSLGAHLNVFAIESFMDELAAAAGKDPVAFRLEHLQDRRAVETVQRAADAFGWRERDRERPLAGSGFGFARYKNLGAYCAVAMEVTVDRETGRIRVRRAVAAVDSGEAINPDGIRNQIEGAIVQSLSWTIEEATAFGDAGRQSFDWSAYPILRFGGVPDRVDVHVIDRPGEPFLGTGEAGQGPAAAALANAAAAATGLRMRDLPLSQERVLSMMKA
jgi:CO/xanthine dehydrogenase Mo-binding subunit